MSQSDRAIRNSDELSLMFGFQNLSDGVRSKTLVQTRGEGVFVFDEHGKDYLEATSSFYCAALGYSEPELIDAAVEQYHQLPFYVSAQKKSVPVVMDLAEKLASLVPLEDAKVAFGATGSEANEFMLKFLRFRNIMNGEEKRTKVVARLGSYHGGTLVASSLTGFTDHHPEFGLPLPGIFHTAQTDHYNQAHDGETEAEYATRLVADLDALLQEEDPETFAAFITEPVSFSCGLLTPPATYFEKLQALLKGYGIRYLNDEVVTGFCRTGNFWGAETYGIEADCMTMAKSITSAYFPVSAVAMSGEFYEGLEKGSDEIGTFAHAGTYAGHPVGAAVALKTIEIIETRNLQENARRMGAYLGEKLGAYEDHPLVGKIRHVGLAGSVEFVLDKATKRRADTPGAIAGYFGDRAMAHGVMVRATGECAVLAPPLIITATEIDELFRRFDLALEDTLDWASREYGV
jgi:4-aminobutyrate---pyruvate transaminase